MLTVPEQLALDLFAATDTTVEARTITERFWRFHRAHPEVYRELVAMARDLKARGHERYGIKALIEVLRWKAALAGVKDAEGWRLNNVFSSRYSRLIEEQEPDLAGFFEQRRLTAA